MKYRLIAADMDGTLLNDELKISERNLAAIKRFQAAGGIFTLATGRSHLSALQFTEKLGLNDVPTKMVCNIGAVVVESRTMKVLNTVAIPPDTAAALCEQAARRGKCVMLYTTDGNKIEKETELSRQYCQKVGITFDAVGDLALYASRCDNIAKIMTILDERELNTEFAELAAAFSQLMFLQSTAPFLKTFRLSGADFDPAMIECVVRGVDKGTGLKYVADSYGIPMSQVMAIGDSYNDVEMIKAAGLGVAMGNAKEKLKQAADYITDTNNADGVAKAIEKFCL